MNADQIRQIVSETVRAELAAFFAVSVDDSSWKQDQMLVSPADEMRIRAMARQNMAVKAAKRSGRG